MVPRLTQRGRPARQHDPEFGEFPKRRIDFDRAGMLFHDDVVAEGQTKARTFAGRLSREKGIEHLLLHSGGIPVPLSRMRSRHCHRGSFVDAERVGS